MEVTQKGIIMLMRSALTGTALELPQDLSMEEVYQTAQRFRITAMVYEGAVLCGIDPSLPVMKTMKQTVGRYRLNSQWQLKNVQRICAAFDKQGIAYMLMKGSVMKKLYPRPEFRYMSDADILIHKEEYSRIQPIMESLGFSEGNDGEYHQIWTIRGLEVELHRQMCGIKDSDYYRTFQGGWDRAIADDGQTTSHHLSAEDTFLYLILHLVKHYRDGGIGCLHIVDLWVYLKANPEINTEELEQTLKELSLIEFYNNLRRLLAYWFEDGESDPVIEHITEEVFKGGPFAYVERYLLAMETRNIRLENSVVRGKIRTFFSRVFPKRNIVQSKYPILKRFPFLLPLIWIIRAVSFIMGRGKSSFRQQYKDLTRAQEQIQNYQKSLEYVGLDFMKE